MIDLISLDKLNFEHMDVVVGYRQRFSMKTTVSYSLFHCSSRIQVDFYLKRKKVYPKSILVVKMSKCLHYLTVWYVSIFASIDTFRKIYTFRLDGLLIVVNDGMSFYVLLQDEDWVKRGMVDRMAEWVVE